MHLAHCFYSIAHAYYKERILSQSAAGSSLLGEMLKAGAARDYGLVNRVVPADHVMHEAMSMAETIASKSPLTVAIGKEDRRRQDDEKLIKEAVESAGDGKIPVAPGQA